MRIESTSILLLLRKMVGMFDIFMKRKIEQSKASEFNIKRRRALDHLFASIHFRNTRVLRIYRSSNLNIHRYISMIYPREIHARISTHYFLILFRWILASGMNTGKF